MSADGLESRLESFENRVVGRSLGESSWKLYRNWITRFEAWMESEGINAPGIGDMEAFDNFLADESRTSYPWDNGVGRPAPPSYAYRTRIIAASAVKMWVRREYNNRIPENPNDICIGEPEPFDPTYLDFDTIDQTIEDARDDCASDDCSVALRLSYDAILRASELVRVQRQDIDLDNGTLYVRASKGSQNTEVGLSPETLDAVKGLMEEYPDREYLFKNNVGGQLNADTWAGHVRDYHIDAGSHAFGRHSPILHRLEAPEGFLDMDESADVFGQVFRRARHSSASMTAKYARIVGIDVPEWAGAGD